MPKASFFIGSWLFLCLEKECAQFIDLLLMKFEMNRADAANAVYWSRISITQPIDLICARTLKIHISFQMKNRNDFSTFFLK